MTDQLLVETTNDNPGDDGRTPSKSRFKATTSKAGAEKTANGVKAGAVKAAAVKANGVKANGVKANVSGSKTAKERTAKAAGIVSESDTVVDLDIPFAAAAMADHPSAVADPAPSGQLIAILDTETDTDDIGAPAPSWLSRVGRWTRTHAATVITGFVAIALAVALALTLLALGNRNAVEQARTSSLASARTYAVELAGYNYRTLGHDFGLVLSHSTPSFRHNFIQTSNALRKTLTQYHATATAKVVSAAVISASPSQADVLVFLDQTVSNTNAKKPSTDRSQVELHLVNVNGNWLINTVTLL